MINIMKTNRNIMIILAMTFMPVVYAGHVSLKNVETLEKQCMDSEEPYYKRHRERLIKECEKIEQDSRGDPKSCAEHYKNVRPHSAKELADTPPEVRVIINPPLPICVKAEEARKQYYKLSP